MLSVIVITKNEADIIADCLQAVEWADEIVVLDSGSDDDTVKICKQFTNLVYVTDWPGFGLQKQRALDKANGDWVLSIDADEIVTSSLRTEIEAAINSTEFFAYRLPRLSSYCGREIRHSGWWPEHVLRLFRREQGAFTPALVHEAIEVDGPVGTLTSPLMHDTARKIDDVVAKMNQYSTLGAEMLFKAGKRSSMPKALSRGAWAFIRTYFLKRGFLDGRAGMMIAIYNAEASFYKYAKLVELQHQADRR